MADINKDVWVGQLIHVKGTGRRWAGAVFDATVVDVRKDDDTVKIKFSDGGYKRFKSEELEKIRVQDNKLHFQPYEFFEDQYDPSSQVTNQLEEMQKEINSAVKNMDFIKAQNLKLQIANIVTLNEELQRFQNELTVAVYHDDFEAAQKLKLEIEKTQARMVSRAVKESKQVDTKDVLNNALKRAMGGGTAGAIAMVAQVCSMMWMRTTMNYQYRYGTTTGEALRTLYKEGGVARFYRGVGPALLQGPLSRFGDTAANSGVMALLDGNASTASLNPMIKTAFASASAAGWRIFLMPLDTIKTTMQVEGKEGVAKVMAKARKNGPSVFYHGGLASAGATMAGHYPFFATFNYLDTVLPEADTTIGNLGRNAFRGFCSSFVSDTTSNSIRVVKTYRQTHEKSISYREAVSEIMAKDGIAGVFGRGLKTRLVANGMQGVMFSVMWKYIEGALFSK